MTSHLRPEQREAIYNGLRVAAVLIHEHGDTYLATVKRDELPRVIKSLLEILGQLEAQSERAAGGSSRRKKSLTKRGSSGEQPLLSVIHYILQAHHDWVSVNGSGYLLIDRRQALLGLVPHLSPGQFATLLSCADGVPAFKAKVSAAKFVQIRSILQRYTMAAGGERRRVVATVAQFPEILQGDWFLGFIESYIRVDDDRTEFMSLLVENIQSEQIEALLEWVAANDLQAQRLYADANCFAELAGCQMARGMLAQNFSELPADDRKATDFLLSKGTDFFIGKSNKTVRTFLEALRDKLSDDDWRQRPQFAALYVICYELVTGLDKADASYHSRMSVKIAEFMSEAQSEQIPQFAAAIDTLVTDKKVLNDILLRAAASCKSVEKVERFEKLLNELGYCTWRSQNDEIWGALRSVSLALAKHEAISAKLLQFFVEQDVSRHTQLVLELVEAGLFNKRQPVSVGGSIFAAEASENFLVLVDSVAFSGILAVARQLTDDPLDKLLGLLAVKAPLAQLSAMSAWMTANGLLEDDFTAVYNKIAARKVDKRLPQYQAFAEKAASEEETERIALRTGMEALPSAAAADEGVAYLVAHVDSGHCERLCGELVTAEVEAYNYNHFGGGVLRGNSLASKLLVSLTPVTQYRAALIEALARDVKPLLPKLLSDMDANPAWATGGESRPTIPADMDKAVWLLNVILTTVEGVAMPAELQHLCQQLYAGICEQYKKQYLVDGQLAEVNLQELEKFALSQVMGVIMLRVVTPALTELTREIPNPADQLLLKLVNAIIQSLANQRFTNRSMQYPSKSQLEPIFRRVMGVAYRVAYQLPVTVKSTEEVRLFDDILAAGVADPDTEIIESRDGSSFTKLKLLAFACLNLRVHDHSKHPKESRNRRSSSASGSAGKKGHARRQSMAAITFTEDQVAIERARAESTYDKQTAVIELSRIALEILLLVEGNPKLAEQLLPVLETAVQDAIEQTGHSTQKFLMAALKEYGCGDYASRLDRVDPNEYKKVQVLRFGGGRESVTLRRASSGVQETPMVRRVLTQYVCTCVAGDPAVASGDFEVGYFATVYQALTTQHSMRAMLDFMINSIATKYPQIPLSKIAEVEMVRRSLALPYEFLDSGELRLQKPVLDKDRYEDTVAPLRAAFNAAWCCAGERDPDNLFMKLSFLRELLTSQVFTTPQEWALVGAGTGDAPLLLRPADAALAALFTQRYCVHDDRVYGIPSLAKFVVEHVCAGQDMDLALLWRIRTVLFGRQIDEAIKAQYSAIDTKKLQYFLAYASLAENVARFVVCDDGGVRGQLAVAIQRARSLAKPVEAEYCLQAYLTQLENVGKPDEILVSVSEVYRTESPKLGRASSSADVSSPLASLVSPESPVLLPPLPLADFRLRRDSLVAIFESVEAIKTAHSGWGLDEQVAASLGALQKRLQALEDQAELPAKVAVESAVDAVKQTVLRIVFELGLEPYQYSDQVQYLCDMVYFCEGDEPDSFLARAQYFNIAYQRPDEKRVAELREQLSVKVESLVEAAEAGPSSAPSVVRTE